MGKAVLKDIFREIKKTKGRFFAIFAICAIGVAFFAGVMASPKDMKFSADKYYDDNNFMDFRILSPIGFNDDDKSAIENTNGVYGVFGAHTADVITTVNSLDQVVKLNSLPDSDLSKNNKNYINCPRLIEGRMPQKDNECVLRMEETKDMPVKVGESICFKSGNDKDINEILENDTYIVTGIIYTPVYLSYDLGQTDIGSGTVSYYVMLKNNQFKSERYEEIYVTVNNASSYNTFSDEYKSITDTVKEALTRTGNDRIKVAQKDISDKYDQEKINAVNKVKDSLAVKVREMLENKYNEYYPGFDTSGMVELEYSSAYAKAISDYDFKALEQSIENKKQEAINQCNDYEWYVLDRSMQASYREYESSTERMNAIATVFPLFFFFVAALVCLTTMTRMVDEQRGQSGIYKALGYNKAIIMLKYMLYSFIASLSGGIIGCIVGLKLFPYVIYNAWGILYKIPPISYDKHFLLSFLSIFSIVFVTCISTFIACNSLMTEVPSQLMQPKAPKPGKKIFLERIKFIWKRIKFSKKVTFRNVFRYKKRFIMTVIGISGCSALLLAGFGIKDSVSGLIDKQYGNILSYDYIITMKTEAAKESTAKIKELLSTNATSIDYLELCEYNSEIDTKSFTAVKDTNISNIGKSVNVLVVNDKEKFQQYISLKDRKDRNKYSLEDDGVCITEKIANDLKLKIGDEIYIQGQGGTVCPVKISHIVEMYVGHYVYISESYYNNVFNEAVSSNTFLGKTSTSDTSKRASFASSLLDNSDVKSFNYISANIDKFETMIKSLNTVTFILILSAACLSFVVLYNLINVNISERIREIATIKVLGFYDREVAIYVFRENMLITILGSLLGLLIGKALHAYIMKTVEIDNVMFGNEINVSSYLFAFGLSILFSLIVQLIMKPKLNSIPMVESLKSID